MCLFPSWRAAIKVPFSAKAAAFVRECKMAGKSAVVEILKRNTNKEGK